MTNGKRDRLGIKDLISYRVHTVANMLSRGAAMRYRREFDVSLWEWRTIALLGDHAPLSLNELARAAGLDKSQISRVVSGLIERGLILRGADESDGRGVQLSLTKSGARVHVGLIGAAKERNDALLGCLTREEAECLDRALVKLAEQARELVRIEEKPVGRKNKGAA